MRRVLGGVLKGSLWVLLLSLVCAAALVGGVMWAVKNPAGSGQLLSWAPGLKVVDPQGSIWGDFQARRLEWRGAKGRSVTVIEPRWRGLKLTWTPDVAWHVNLQADALSARRVDVLWPADPSTSASLPPSSLNLPMGVLIPSLIIDRIDATPLGAQAITDVRGSLALQQGRLLATGTGHRITVAQLRWQGWRLQGQATAAATGQMMLNGQWQAESALDRVDVAMSGPLLQPLVDAQVKVLARHGGQITQAQALSAQLELAPFEPWPVLKAKVSATQFDAQRLLAALPATALSGEIVIQPRQALPGAPGAQASAASGKREPQRADLLAQVNLRNERPGVWDAGLLPLLTVRAEVALPAQASMGHLAEVGQTGNVQAEWVVPAKGAGARAGARLLVEGHWDLKQRQQTRLVAKVVGLDASGLHSRAPVWLLGGQVNLQGQADQSWQISGQLDGKDGGGRTLALPMRAQWLAHWWPGQLKLDNVTLEAGQAKALGQGQWLAATATKPQTLSAQAKLTAFDPAVWMPWPRPAGDAAKRTRLDGEVKAELNATDNALGWQGQANGLLNNSVLLGVPVQAQWAVNAPKGDVKASLNFSAGGNQGMVQASWPMPQKPVSAEQGWSLAGAQVDAQIDAPTLVALQPWAQAMGWRGVGGQVKLNGQWVSALTPTPSPWGQWRSQGQLSADGLVWDQGEAGRWSAQGARAQWSVSSEVSGSQQPWAIKAELAKAQVGAWVVQQGTFSLDGPSRDQRLALQARVDLPERKLPGGGVIKESVRAQVRAQGGWQGATASSAWLAKVQSASVQPLSVAPSGPWLDVDPFELRWSPGRDGQGSQWQASPTRFRVFGAVLALKQALWQSAVQGAGQLDLNLALEPLKLAEVLARLQPGAGWGGDLTIHGQLKARALPGRALEVDAQVLRQGGDLSLTEAAIDGNNLQRLGVRQIQIDLKARDGVWTLSELLDGRVLGQFQGQQVVQVRDPAALPGPQDPLTGQFTAKVDNLRPLGVWAPAGWRLGGQLLAQADLSGQLGVPQYKGRVTGNKLSLGHALSGVQLEEGELRLSLQGDQARLEQFTARSGGATGGRLSVSGEALLGAEPTATLTVKADRFALFQRVDRRAVVSGEAQLVLDALTVKADGRVAVDEGLIDLTYLDAPTVGDDVVVTNRPDADDEEEAMAASGRKRKLSVNMALELGEQLRLKGRGLDTRLGGTLRLSTPSGRAQVQGAVKAMDGTYAAYGQKLLIERGTITFTGPIENPRLDIQAMRAQSPTASSSDVKVGVLISGTALDPRVRLYSEPAMSETEKLSWLVLGRGPAGLGGADIGLLQTAASALWAGEGGSPKDTVISAIGLDELSVRQTDGAVRDTIVSVGKQISSRWYLGYERSLNATTGSWQAIYRLAQRFTLRAQTGDDNALDLIWSWRWD